MKQILNFIIGFIITLFVGLPIIDYYVDGAVKENIREIFEKDPVLTDTAQSSEDYIINQFIDSITLEDVINDKHNMNDYDLHMKTFQELPDEIITMIVNEHGANIGFYNIAVEYFAKPEYYINEYAKLKLPGVDLSGLPGYDPTRIKLQLSTTIDSVIPNLIPIQ